MKIRKQRIGLFVLFLLLGALGIWASNLPTAAAPTAQATPTPCSTPATTSGRGRVVGGASSCTTTALPNKAGAKFGGGGDVLVPCRGFLAPEGSMVFGVYPANQFVLLGKPHASNDIAVQWCDWGSGDLFAFRLTDPTGRVIAEEEGAAFTHNFPTGTPSGDYILTITGRDDVIQQNFMVSDYTGPALQLQDPVTGEDKAATIAFRPEVNRQRGIQVRYTGFEPEATIEVGLYANEETVENFMVSFGWNRLDTWQLLVDDDGTFDEFLEFPASLAEGEYLIVACDVDDCDLGFSLLEVEPLGPPNGVSVPPLAWHEFYLPAVERQARVDPVGAWDGLRLRSGPGSNFARIGVLPANALVDMLNGPDSAGGVDWYEVHSIDSGDEGWVSGEYLIFTLSDPITVPSERMRVSFRPGMTSSSFTASLSVDVPLAYAIRAQGGQELIIETDRRDVGVEVVDSSQIPLVVSEREEAYWRFLLPQNDDYIVILNGYQRTQVRIEVPAR